MELPRLDQFKRIVVKVGSSLLVDRARGEVKRDWLHGLADDLTALHRRGADVLVVSSGAVALGRSVLGLPPGALKLEDSQASAAVGQIALARIWAEALAERKIVAGQVLVTLGDTEERRRYLNARETLERLLFFRAAPIINENDTVATSEIRYGDNDRLAARVATMASADLLILLSDVDGLYDAPPSQNPRARLIPVVPRISAEIEGMAGGAASELLARRDADQDRGGQDRHVGRRPYGDRRWPGEKSRGADRRRSALHLVPHSFHPAHFAQKMDRRFAGSARRAAYRRRRRPRHRRRGAFCRRG